MILDEILETKEREVAELRHRGEDALRRRVEEAPPARGFRRALDGGGSVSVIAEFKRRSPSAGAIAEGADPVRVAGRYREGGAGALSVLTDGPYFDGSLDDLRRAREASGLPVLRKDFLVHPLQLLEARGAGADAVLLVVRALTPDRLGELLAVARELGMDALVEVHDGDELETALARGAGLIGVNARDLSTFEVDLERCRELVATVPPGRTAVAESGVEDGRDVERLGRAGADAVLVGSVLMRRGPERVLPGLTGVERRERAPSGAAAPEGSAGGL